MRAPPGFFSRRTASSSVVLPPVSMLISTITPTAAATISNGTRNSRTISFADGGSPTAVSGAAAAGCPAPAGRVKSDGIGSWFTLAAV